VSVVIPLGAGFTITAFVVKVSQGNTPVTGVAQLYQDNDDDGHAIPGASCNIPATPGTSVCMVMLSYSQTIEKDSLSCFIETDSGSFEGGSCSILIDVSTAGP
jgi:hypothetical protein